jgi:hypothetical protein
LNEGIDKSQFEKIAKAQRGFIVQGLDFRLPYGIRVMNRLPASEVIASNPTPDFSRGDASQPCRFWDRI